MSIFKKDTLSSFIICVISLSILMTISVFDAVKVNAVSDGFVEIDYGDYRLYIPEETVAVDLEAKGLNGASDLSSNEYEHPDLNIPAFTGNEVFPDDTYESRSIYRGIEPWEYIPVNFDIFMDGANGHYYNSDYYEGLEGKPLSELNNALNEYDPFIDTFKSIYDPGTHQFLDVFPLMGDTPEQLTLLLDKNSYFAEGLTLDVEEWWDLTQQDGRIGGGETTYSIRQEWGLTESQQESALLTHGFGVDIGAEYRVGDPISGTGWSASIDLSYEYSDARGYAFTRTVESARTEDISYTFGQFSGQNDYKWAVYGLVTRTKVNYTSGLHFSELDNVFVEDLDDYGLRPDMNSYVTQMENSMHIAVERPIYQVDPGLERPQNLVAKSDFRDLTTTLSWDQVTDPNVEGFAVYKNDMVALYITDPTRTSWIDTEVEPDKNNTYYVKSIKTDYFFDIRRPYTTLSLSSNVVSVRTELTAPIFRAMTVGCSIPFVWTDDQIPTGERTYYKLYIGDPALGGIFMGSYEGTDTSVNISSELYDVLLANQNEDFYIVKEVIYNGRLIQSPATGIPNHFTVTETAFLFSNTGFNGDCVTVSKDQRINLSGRAYNFDNDLASMLVQGNIYVRLFPEVNFEGYTQTIFTEEDGFAQVRDFDDMIIGVDNASSIWVLGQQNGVYLFSGSDYTGELKFLEYVGEWWDVGINEYNYKVLNDIIGEDTISSVKVKGPYAVALYEHRNFLGTVSVIKEDWGESISRVGDNQTSSLRLFYDGNPNFGGVWLFREPNFSGENKFYRLEPRLLNGFGYENGECEFLGSCDGGFGSVSSVLTIGDFGVALYQNNSYGGRVQAIRHRDAVVGSHASNIGDNEASSFKIFGKGVYLMNDANYTRDGGYVKIDSPGEYRSTDWIGFQENTLSSIFVVGYKATVYDDIGFGESGTSEVFIDKPSGTRYDPDLSDNTIGNNAASSIVVEEVIIEE
ncbi:beta/gamma crystallin family protein [Chengkuizengella sediminis]|uniref:beta/gamma crystallin family protein n=1 Tax=Chengkuizengella sediminis TaxID=1885917 RepID=UPI00138A4BA5|nr:beta/gamma crystallin family protein [Chengkuizengella sediminis]NDI34635.1 beta/gamma crystallin family protein [Chengkuizengella sediminis]